MVLPCFNSLITKSKYFRSRCKTNKSLVLLIDRLKIVSVHDIIERFVPITYLQKIITN